MSKCQFTEEFTRKLCALLYYVYSTTYNQINCNCLRVLIVYFYIIIQFHPRRRFWASLSVRVSDSDHPVMYARQFFRNKPGHNIYRCMSVRSTQHHTIIHNLTILHMQTFLCQPVTRAKYTVVCKHASHDIIRFYIILQFCIRRHFLRQPFTCAINIIHFKIRFKNKFVS